MAYVSEETSPMAETPSRKWHVWATNKIQEKEINIGSTTYSRHVNSLVCIYVYFYVAINGTSSLLSH
jgi:hypothetical protein